MRDSIVAALESERAFDIATGRAAAIESAVNGGASVEEAAADMMNVSVSQRTITRQSTDVSPRLRSAVFQQKKPAAGQQRVGTVVTDDQRYVVYNLTGVAPGRPESIPLEERDQGKLQLAMQSGSQDYASMVLDLEADADIVKSEDVLAQDTLFE